MFMVGLSPGKWLNVFSVSSTSYNLIGDTLVFPNLSFLTVLLWVQVPLLLAQFLGYFGFALLNKALDSKVPFHLKLFCLKTVSPVC